MMEHSQTDDYDILVFDALVSLCVCVCICIIFSELLFLYENLHNSSSAV